MKLFLWFLMGSKENRGICNAYICPIKMRTVLSNIFVQKQVQISCFDFISLRLFINSFWHSDAIWRQGSRSTLVQVMACCLTAPSHYLNQCWLIIAKVQWCSSEGNFHLRYRCHLSLKLAWKFFLKILLKSPRGQWVKTKTTNPCFTALVNIILKHFWSCCNRDYI